MTGEKIKLPDFEKPKNNIKDVGKSLTDIVKKVARWGLGILGVRSAINGVRQAISIVQGHNKNIAGQIDAMKMAIANALIPVVQKVINLIARIMQMINYVYHALTGKNLFNFSKAFKDAKKNAQGTAKATKDISKTIAGFDEMNVANDNKTGGAGGGVGATKFDNPFEGWDKFEPPEWLQKLVDIFKWLVENKDIIIAVLSGIGAGLLALKLGTLAKDLGLVKSELGGIKALGIGLAVAGLVYAIENIISFIKDPAFTSFMGIIQGIATAVIGVAIAFGLWPVAVIGAIALIVATIVKNYDTIIGWFDKAESWIEKNVLQKLEKKFGLFGTIIATYISVPIGMIRSAFEGLYGGIKKVVDGIVLIFKGDFKNGIKKVFSGLKDILLAPINALIGGINKLIDGVNKIHFDIPDWVPLIGGKDFKLNIPHIPKLAQGGIVNMPSRGIPVGNALAGERGAEGVIPLTDSQQMALLGEAIGKYINLSATIPVYVGSRQVAREMRKIELQDAFAGNR